MADRNLSQKEILSEIKKIKQELQTLQAHKLIRIYNSLSLLTLFFFFKGIVLGFGTVVGATVVVSIFIYLLSQIEFVPIVGEWVKAIIAEIQVK